MFSFVSLTAFAQLNDADSEARKYALGSLADSASISEQQKLNAAAIKITHRIDSLKVKGLPTRKYKKQLDSVNRSLKNIISLQAARQKINSRKAKIHSKEDSLQNKVNVRRRKLEARANRKKYKLDSVTSGVKDPTGNLKTPSLNTDPVKLENQISNSTQLKAQSTKLPSDINVPGSPPISTQSLKVPNESAELSKLNTKIPVQEISKAESELKKIEGAPTQILNGTDAAKKVNEVKKDEKELAALENQSKNYRTNLKKIKEGDSATVASMEKNAEATAKKELQNNSELKEINKETANLQAPKNFIQQYDEMIVNFKKQDLSQIKNFSTKQLGNPFVGQEAKLKAGVVQLDKLKKKYKNVPDSRYLPKFVPNEMKGRPLKERILPGISFQIYSGTKMRLDLSAYAMYRLTGRIRVGGGASDLLLVDGNKVAIASGHIYALRIMADFRLIPGLHFHAEENWTHYGVGSVAPYQKPSDPPLVGWSSKLNAGAMKTFKVSRKFDGNMQLLYNTLDWTNFPQNKNVTMRFGFEYKLGVRKKSKPILK